MDNFVTPVNGEYLALAFTATFGTLLLLLGSMYSRYRNAIRDMEMIEKLADE